MPDEDSEEAYSAVYEADMNSAGARSGKMLLTSVLVAGSFLRLLFRLLPTGIGVVLLRFFDDNIGLPAKILLANYPDPLTRCPIGVELLRILSRK
jgi:hypothetical protein